MPARVVITGPGRFSKRVTTSTVLTRLKPGAYRVRANPVELFIGTSTATVDPPKTRIRPSTRARVTITYGTGSATDTPTSSTPAPTPSLPPVSPYTRVDLSAATAVAVEGTSSGVRSTGTRSGGDYSGLVGVEPDGSIYNPLTYPGASKVVSTLAAPDGRVFLAFDLPVYLAPWQECWLVQVSSDRTTTTCVDPDTVVTSFGGNATGRNPSIQMDAGGTLVYKGGKREPDGRLAGTFLRRNAAGAVTDLVGTEYSVSDFLVLPDGTVLVAGEDLGGLGTRHPWLRRYGPDGSMKVLLSETPISFLQRFPDGNVYIGLWDRTGAVARYLPSSDSIDTRMWIGGELVSDPVNPPPPTAAYLDLSTSPICQPDVRAERWEFCGAGGSYISAAHDTGTGREVVLAGMASSGVPHLLMEYYPEVRVLPTNVNEPRVIGGHGDTLAVAGRDINGADVLVLHDLNTQQERWILTPGDALRVDVIDYSTTTGKLHINAVRTTDSASVLGSIDMSTGQITTTVTPIPVTDLQTLR